MLQRRWVRRAAHALFWSWNLIFLAFMVLGFAPQFLPELLQAVQRDEMPAAFLAYAVILTTIPVVAILLGYFRFRRQPDRLLMLGYGIEGPLMLVLAIRFFAVRELMPPVALLLAIAVVGMIAFLWQLLDPKHELRGRLISYLRLVGLTLLLVTGLYTSLWIAFYAVPLATVAGRNLLDLAWHLPELLGTLWQAILSFRWRDLWELEWAWLPFVVLGFLLMIYTATLFVGMPIAVPIFYFQAWRRGLQALGNGRARTVGLLLMALVLAICATLFVQVNVQPQHSAFALLAKTPTTPAEAAALLTNQERIRAGLLNAYLAQFRYFSAMGEVLHIRDIYRDALNLSDEQAVRVQQLYEWVAQPVLYQPVKPVQAAPTSSRFSDNQALAVEPNEAAERYEAFFDQPILDGERDAVVQAVRSTWSVNQAQAAWQAVDDREVYLVRQEVTLTEQGDWAEGELYEVYQNQTSQRQEVVYYFNLPESAVITGVWLGNSSDRAKRFVYHVAPRGAAQAVYRNEVRRNMDPALVEQIGPRQYRLRIFPIEPETMNWDTSSRLSTIKAGPLLHLWLTWRVLAQDGQWPLPRLAEQRNVYWNEATVRQVNGVPMAVEAAAWLPPSLPAADAIQPQTHLVDFPGGETVILEPIGASVAPALPDTIQLAVVLDRSRSMAPYAVAVQQALTELDEAVAVEVDLYLTASAYRGEEPSVVPLSTFDAANILYYGGQNAAELFQQFTALHKGQEYAAIFMLTDDDVYTTIDESTDLVAPPAPVWMIHLGDRFPIGYDDATLEAIQASGGGVAGSIAEAVQRLQAATVDGVAESDGQADRIDGYRWLTLPTATAHIQYATAMRHAPSDDFAALAARRRILAAMADHRTALKQLPILDELHAIALEHSIVTPYSSMIVLVTSQQEQLLKDLSAAEDRFAREHEAVGETEAANPLAVTAVPEPEEWMLIGLATMMLAGYMYRQRKQMQRKLFSG